MNGLRIKCPQCGKVMDINSPMPCPDCNTPLAAYPGTIQVYRMGSPIGVAAGYGVYINGHPFGHIGNTETVAYTLPFGTYTFHMTCGMTRKCKDITVTITPEAPVAYLKARIKAGFWSNCIIIEPATADQMPNG